MLAFVRRTHMQKDNLMVNNSDVLCLANAALCHLIYNNVVRELLY